MVLVKPKEDPVDVKIERVLISQQEAVVILATQNGDYPGRVLPVFVDLGQAMNIQVGLEGRRAGRPLTHDLMTNVMNEMGVNVDKVVIEEIAANTFFATLHLNMEKSGKQTPVTFDARPSDCIALAVRAGAAIKVRRKVLDAASVEREKLFGATGNLKPAEDEEDDGDDEEEDDEDEEGDQEGKEGPQPRKKPPSLDPGDIDKP